MHCGIGALSNAIEPWWLQICCSVFLGKKKARKTASGDGEVTKSAKSWGCIKRSAKRMATRKILELADEAAVGGGEVAAK